MLLLYRCLDPRCVRKVWVDVAIGEERCWCHGVVSGMEIGFEVQVGRNSLFVRERQQFEVVVELGEFDGVVACGGDGERVG